MNEIPDHVCYSVIHSELCIPSSFYSTIWIYLESALPSLDGRIPWLFCPWLIGQHEDMGWEKEVQRILKAEQIFMNMDVEV